MNDNTKVVAFGKPITDKPTVMDKTPELIKLITGEDIIGNVVVGNATNATNRVNTLTIENPVRIVIIPQPGGQPNMAFMPVSPFGETKKLVVDENHVVYRLQVNKQIEAEYKRTFSGLVTPVIPDLIVPKK